MAMLGIPGEGANLFYPEKSNKIYHWPPQGAKQCGSPYRSGIGLYPIKAQWLETTGQITFAPWWKAEEYPESRWGALDGDKRWVALGYDCILGIFNEQDKQGDPNVVHDIINLCDIVSVKPCKSPQHTSFEIQGACEWKGESFPIYFKFKTASAYDRKEWVFFIKQAMGLNVLDYVKNEHEDDGDEKKDDDEVHENDQENLNEDEEKDNENEEKDNDENRNDSQDDAADTEGNEDND